MALVKLIPLLLTILKYGQGVSFDYEYLPHNDELPAVRTRTNESRGAPPHSLQVYDASIQKCRCDGSEAWDGKDCTLAQTYVAVTNPNTNEVTGVPTSAFRVAIGEVRCSQDQVKVPLDPNKGFYNQFSLLPNGSLYWQRHAYEKYCFDHTFDEDGSPNLWKAEVCLPPPVVPRCCNSMSPSSDGACNTGSVQRYSPPIMVDELVLQWLEINEKSTNVICSEYENLLTLPLNTSKANLKYESKSVFLSWSLPDGREYSQREDYCVELDIEEKNYVASVCYTDQERLCSSATCVRKCCPEGKVMVGTECAPVEDRTDLLWTPTFTDASDLESSVRPPEDLTWLYGLPQCNLFVLNPDDEKKEKFLLLNNGKLFRPEWQEFYLPSRYCIENFVEQEEPHTRALVCFPEGSSDDALCGTINRKVYPVLLLVSSVCLGVTLVVYISLADIRDKLHSRCRISLVAALFVAYTLLATTKLARDTLPETLCSCFASVTHLGMLAAFFWLNVMCFDMWRTLRKTRIAVDGGRAAQRRFLFYSLYAWGCPLFITIVAVVMEHLPPSYDVIRPNFKTCWFQDKAAYWVYMYGWMMVLVVANVIFFILVAIILIKAQNDPLLKRSREYNRERMWLYAKLFLVMGVTWLGEVVSWQAGACRASIATDILNALQGFTLFLVFVCKRTTLKKLQGKCGCTGSGISRPSTTLTSTLSYFSKSSSVCRTRDNNVCVPVGSSTRRSSASPNSRDCNVPSTVPLQTVRETPDEPSELSHGEAQETTTIIHERDCEVDKETGTVQETTPLKTIYSTPSQSTETHLEN
ncbi:G-protein coupled receptor Mth2-like [Scylla paramamosain]|uniref:G-protein coupled receptor Mth2-like n=1 Tax=Scylla paramamosain TaxID=85552 RepID=UPI00308368C2